MRRGRRGGPREKQADGQIPKRRHVQPNGIAHHHRMRREGRGRLSAPSVLRATCAPPMSNGWSPKVLEILILSVRPPALTCTMRRRVWCRKVWACPGMAACGAVAHVPIQCWPSRRTPRCSAGECAAPARLGKLRTASAATKSAKRREARDFRTILRSPSRFGSSFLAPDVAVALELWVAAPLTERVLSSTKRISQSNDYRTAR